MRNGPSWQRGRAYACAGFLSRLHARSAPIALLALAAFLLPFVVPRSGWADTPVQPTSGGDNTSGASTDDAKPHQLREVGPRGNGAYTVPLQFPKARGSVQPPSALSYSSEVAETPFGRGWLFSLPSIRREGNTLRLGDGRKLVPICKIRSTSGCERNFDTEPAFLETVVGWDYYRPEHGDHTERYFVGYPRAFKTPNQVTVLGEFADGTIVEYGAPLDAGYWYYQDDRGEKEGRNVRKWFQEFGPGLAISARGDVAEYLMVRSYGREALTFASGAPQPKNVIRYYYGRLEGNPYAVYLTDIFDTPTPKVAFAHHVHFDVEKNKELPVGLRVRRIDVTAAAASGPSSSKAAASTSRRGTTSRSTKRPAAPGSLRRRSRTRAIES